MDGREKQMPFKLMLKATEDKQQQAKPNRQIEHLYTTNDIPYTISSIACIDVREYVRGGICAAATE